MRVAALVLSIGFVLVPASGAATGHSASACAVAWNRSASSQLLATVRQTKASTAFIDPQATVSIDVASAVGGATKTSSAVSIGCSIHFVLANGGAVVTWGAWKNNGIRKWHELVPLYRSVVVPYNARVRKDGTVGFTG